MWSWMRIVLFLCALWLAVGALAANPPGFFNDELDVDQYDCILALKPAADLSATSRAVLMLERGDDKNALQLTVTRTTLTLSSLCKGQRTEIASIPSGVTPGALYRLTVMRRGAGVSLQCGNAILFQGETPRSEGKIATLVNEPGWGVAGARIQRLEPVVFADDFMRTAADNGLWAIERGKWRLQSAWDDVPQGNQRRFQNVIFAQNPFAWVGAAPAGEALCTTGNAFWEDYTMTVALRPAEKGAAGVQVNMTDPRNGIRVRWSPGNDRGATGNQLTVYQLHEGKATLLAKDAGGYIPGQWYKFSVESKRGSLRVLIDDRERIALPNVTPWRGSVGLYCEGSNGTCFDDVTVYGSALASNLLLESRQTRIKERFKNDTNGMQKWANARGDWQSFPNAPGFRMHRWDIAGNQWLVVSVKPMKLSTGELVMTLHGDGKDPLTGYRAVIKPTTSSEDISCTLYRGKEQLAHLPQYRLPFGKEYRFCFRHEDTAVQLEIDDKMILEATDRAPITGTIPAYAANGIFALAHDVMVIGHRAFDYTFAEAPIDWFSEGTWQPSTRWSCSPHWSFMAGWSRGDAVLWHKQRFSGDQSFEAFVGLKMEYPGMRATEHERLRDLAVTICGDGHNPRSGYTGIFNGCESDTPGMDKQKKPRIILLRNGVEVAGTQGPVYPQDGPHQHWFQLELRKQGSTVEFWIEGEEKPRLTYTDPQPIDGGVPAVWTTDNGINVARVRIHATTKPQPRTDAQVVIGQPKCPEWTSMHKPLVVTFPEYWSASGSPAHLTVTPRNIPVGETGAIKIDGTCVTITPNKPGEHWYQIYAVDTDNNISPAVNISFQVFNTEHRRDDKHAVILYRFMEGQGSIIHDVSQVTPNADILISQTATTNWLPNQGLTVHGTTPLVTRRGVNKLMAAVRKKAMTIECWVSTETIAPPNDVRGCILSWEQTGKPGNFALGQNWYNLFYTMHSAPHTVPGESGTVANAEDAARPWLQHIVATWDGKMVALYSNGKRVAESPDRMTTNQAWSADAPLILANTDNGNSAYMGTYYLVAIHDRSFTAAEIQRQYAAGPAG